MVTTKLILHDGEDAPEWEIYLNAKDEIFIGNNDVLNAWLIINKEDWQNVKSFIDEQFKNVD